WAPSPAWAPSISCSDTPAIPTTRRACSAAASSPPAAAATGCSRSGDGRFCYHRPVARVFLLNPPSPEPVRTPLLAFCHLASSLRAGGHQVALLDASAPFAPRDPDEIAARIGAFAPDLV